MKYLPINLNITGKKILMIGGGKVAKHKLKNIAQFSPNLTVLAPEIDPEIIDKGYPTLHKKYEEGDLKGFYLIYACTADSRVNRQIKKDAEVLGLLVNVADDPQNCDFISPAIYKKDHLSVAVSSGGTNVKKAVQWRNQIKSVIENNPEWDGA